MIVQITESQLKHLLSKELDEHYGIRYIEQWGENELLLPLFHHLYGLENLGGPLSSLTPEESVEKVSQIIGGSKHTFMVLTNNFRKFTRSSKSTKRNYKPTAKQEGVFKKYAKYPKSELRKFCIDVLKDFEQDDKRKEKHDNATLGAEIGKIRADRDSSRKNALSNFVDNPENFSYSGPSAEEPKSSSSYSTSDDKEKNKTKKNDDSKGREEAIKKSGLDPKKLKFIGSSNKKKDINESLYSVIREIKQNRRKNRY